MYVHEHVKNKKLFAQNGILAIQGGPREIILF